MLGLDTNTLIVAAVMGGVTILVAWRYSFAVFSALVLLLPFRDLSIRWMNVNLELPPAWINAISRWWFILVLALVFIIVLKWLRTWIKKPGIEKIGVVEISFFLAILWAVISVFTSPNFAAAFTSLRGYLQPMAVFVIAAAIRPSRKQLETLLILMIVVGLIMVAFEIWQVTGWTAEEYRARGYLRQNGELVSPTIHVQGQPYIRPTSTVSGPNELGVDMMLLMLVGVFSAYVLNRPLKFISMILVPIFAVGLALTFSRSAILGTLVAFLAFGLLLISTRRLKEMPQSSQIHKQVLIGAAVFILLTLLFVLTGVFDFLAGTITNLTNEYHIIDSLEALQYLIRNPGGVGMGMVAPKGALLLIETEALYHVEGSLFQIAMEMGVWGLALWLFFWGVCLYKIWNEWAGIRSSSLQIIAGVALTGWIGALVAFAFLPLMQSINLMVWLWAILGLGISSNTLQQVWSSAESDP
jgi:O-antigen ligase